MPPAEAGDRRAAARAAGIALLLIGLAANPWFLGVAPGREGLFQRTLILGVDAALVGAGALILALKPRAMVLMAAGVTLLLGTAALEVAFRLLYANLPGNVQLDDSLGWMTKPNHRSERSYPGFGLVHYSTSTGGFRRFDTDTAGRRRVLIIGDSYTQNAGVSDGGSYFDWLAEHDSALAVFAYGAGGYGSAQEYLLLDQWFDRIRPDVILWQLSANDIVNNDWRLEAGSLNNNNWLPRAYYEDGSFVVRFPSRHRLAQWSRLFRYAQSRLAIVELKVRTRLQLDVGYAFADGQPDFERAKAVTSAIMGLVRRRAGGVPIVSFSFNEQHAWIAPTFGGISRAHGIHYIAAVGRLVQEAKARGVQVDGSPYDPHFNAAGNALAGEMLLDSLRALGLAGPPVR